MPKIDTAKCNRCGACIEECPSLAIAAKEDNTAWVKYPEFCSVCGHCTAICPTGAVAQEELPPGAFMQVGTKPSSDLVRNLLLSRRSTRVFSDRPVPRELIQELITCGTNAGTASNAQSEGFIVVADSKVMVDLSNMVLEAFWNAGLKYMGNSLGRAVVKASYGPELTEQMGQYYSLFKKMRDREIPARSIFRNAPAIIVTHGLRKNPLAMTNAALATRNMEIMALPMGLGTCWIGFLVVASQRDKKVREFLGLPADRTVCGAITVGFPKREYKKAILRKERSIRWI